LSKSHAEKLIQARKLARAIIASVIPDATVEIAHRKEGHELGEEKLPGVHCQVLSTVWRGKDYQNPADGAEIDTAEKPP